MSKTLVHWIFRLGAIAMIANGVWMLSSAFSWFFNIPAGLPDTGEPNGHLIRDVGLVYLLLGGALLWATRQLRERRAVFVCVALFMLGHALGHVVEISSGILPHSHWKLDLVPVLIPGALFTIFLLPAPWRWLASTND